MLIKREDCCLLVIDVQDRLLPAMYDPEAAVAGCRRLLDAARTAGVPVLVTEHYPAGIGHTAALLDDLIPAGAVMEKIYFSCFAEPSVRRRIRALGRQTLVLAGMEAHVCLGQSALDLNAAGYHVVVPPDATASRTRLDHETALLRLARDGADIVEAGVIAEAWCGPAAGAVAGQADGRMGGTRRARLQ
jgi:nicotinamidase-related amidase